MIWAIIFTLVSGLLIFLPKLLRRPAPLWKMDGMGSHGPGSRNLGMFEKVLARWGEHGFNQAGEVIFFCSKLPITENIMRQASVAVAKRHPQLRMKLGRENGVFTYMKEIENFKIDLQVCNENDWKKIVEDELLDVIDAEKGPLWRMKFLPNASHDHENQINYPYQAVCVITMHHAIIDGISGFYKCNNDLLSYLHDILDGKKLAPKSLPLLPPIDAYLDSAERYSLINNLKANLLEIAYGIPSFRKYLEKLNQPKTPLFMKKFGEEITRNSKAPLKTCIIPIELTSEQTSRLIASCKKHKVTVTAAIQTACSIAYCSLADGGTMKEAHKLNIITNYSLLDSSAPADLVESLGVFTTVMAIENRVWPDRDFWNIARGNNIRLKVGLARGRKERAIEKLLFLKYNDKDPDNKFNGERTDDLVVSNIGRLRFLGRGDTSHVQITGGYSFSAHATSGRVFTNMIATLKGKLFWAVSYCPRATSMRLAQAFVDLTLKTLFSAVNN